MKVSRQIITRIAGFLCFILVAVFCCLPIYDFFAPWPPASQAFSQFGRHLHFCVGMGGESSTTVSGGHTTVTSSTQRAFILMRAATSWPKMVFISQDQDGRITVDESVFGFWAWLVFFGGVLCGAWRWFLRHLVCKTQSPNKSLQPTPVGAPVSNLRLSAGVAEL